MSEQYYSIKKATLTDMADKSRAKTGKSDRIEVEDYATEIEGISGSGAELNMGTCTVNIVPYKSNYHYIAGEQVNGTTGNIVRYLYKQYTGGSITAEKIRCGSVLNILGPDITDAEITNGGIFEDGSLFIIKSKSLSCKMPTAKDTIVTIKLKG